MFIKGRQYQWGDTDLIVQCIETTKGVIFHGKPVSENMCGYSVGVRRLFAGTEFTEVDPNDFVKINGRNFFKEGVKKLLGHV